MTLPIVYSLKTVYPYSYTTKTNNNNIFLDLYIQLYICTAVCTGLSTDVRKLVSKQKIPEYSQYAPNSR